MSPRPARQISKRPITDLGPVTSTTSTGISLAIGYARLQNLDLFWILALRKNTGTGQDPALIYNRMIEWSEYTLYIVTKRYTSQAV